LARKPDFKNAKPRFGIGEWFGTPLQNLPAEQRLAFGQHQRLSKKERSGAIPSCPFLVRRNNPACSKDGGVCSLKLYACATHAAGDGEEPAKGVPVEGDKGQLRATCPYRFHEDDEVFRWVGEVILEDASPKMLGEVGFLEAYATMDAEAGDDVGRIDMVLMKSNHPPGFPLEWCAVEIQAVYFSGSSMRGEFNVYADEGQTWLAYPVGKRRPDYRSSGPKRLMPQLQIKVPTLRRWGKKMAVVVDRAFFDSMGEMTAVNDISNADIAWFVVRFEESGAGRAKLVRDKVVFTTLERSVEGLTGGQPVSLKTFESRIKRKDIAGGAEVDMGSVQAMTDAEDNEENSNVQ
jgi:hypothetical protein